MALGNLENAMVRKRAAKTPASRCQDWFVHIGMHKTATSWLQAHLFGNPSSGFHAAGNSGQSVKQRSKELAKAFYLDERDRLVQDVDFDPVALRDRFCALDVPRGAVPVLSSERLSGHPLSNGFDRSTICQRIKAVLPDAKVLLVIREQRSMILSNYMQYLEYGGWHTLRGFVDGPADPRQPRLSADFWNYDRLVRLYLSTFGPEQLLVLPFEMFVRTPEDFIDRICSFSGVKTTPDLPSSRVENGRSKHVPSYYLRWLGSLTRPSSANGFFPPTARPGLTRMVDTAVRSTVTFLTPAVLEQRVKKRLEIEAADLARRRYGGSNRVTADLIGIDLADYGYDVG